ncbi:MAG: hypothetical protein AB7F31_01095 [Parachlamydiales bacterium]
MDIEASLHRDAHLRNRTEAATGLAALGSLSLVVAFPLIHLTRFSTLPLATITSVGTAVGLYLADHNSSGYAWKVDPLPEGSLDSSKKEIQVSLIWMPEYFPKTIEGSVKLSDFPFKSIQDDVASHRIWLNTESTATFAKFGLPLVLIAWLGVLGGGIARIAGSSSLWPSRITTLTATFGSLGATVLFSVYCNDMMAHRHIALYNNLKTFGTKQG